MVCGLYWTLVNGSFGLRLAVKAVLWCVNSSVGLAFPVVSISSPLMVFSGSLVILVWPA